MFFQTKHIIILLKVTPFYQHFISSNAPQQSPRCAHFTLLVNLFTVFAAIISQAKDNISKFVNGDNRLNTKT